jgi:DNA-binding NarL/FixJ family response regulator
MAKNLKTHIFCYDDHRGFSGDIQKRFADESRYVVISFQTREEFISSLEAFSESHFCKVAILGVHDNKEQYEMIDQLTTEIKRIDYKTGVVLLGPPDKMTDIQKSVLFNIDAYIPKNANSILRIHNIVKKLISEHNIRIFRKRRNLSFYILSGFVILTLLLTLVAYFRFPEYF